MALVTYAAQARDQGTGRRAGSVDGGRARGGFDDGLELAVEDLLEQVAASPRRPELEFGVVLGADPQDHEVVGDLSRHLRDATLTAPVESVGDPQDCGEATHPLAIAGTQ